MTDPITSFRGAHGFLSNFTKAEVYFAGVPYRSVEHAFQAAKTFDLEARENIRNTASPVSVKRFGRRVKLRWDWEELSGSEGMKFKEQVMLDLLRKKFERPDLAAKLLATGDAPLIEGNHWHDNFWGCCDCATARCARLGSYEQRLEKGNMLGKLLMRVRGELRVASNSEPARLASDDDEMEQSSFRGDDPRRDDPYYNRFIGVFDAPGNPDIEHRPPDPPGTTFEEAERASALWKSRKRHRAVEAETSETDPR